MLCPNVSYRPDEGARESRMSVIKAGVPYGGRPIALDVTMSKISQITSGNQGFVRLGCGRTVITEILTSTLV